jgi:pimeloyl-ACP methyl ester carboxylesterase
MTGREAPRSVPGVTPVLRRRLQRFYGVVTRVSPRLAGRLALTLFLTPPRRRLETVDAPVFARARRSQVAVGGRTVRIFEWGDPSHDAILLLHGWGSHAARFGGFVTPLLGAGFRVVGFDAPAHGESAGRRSDLRQFRESLADVIGARGPVRGIVAHSLGGAAAVWLCAEAPPDALRALVCVGMPRDSGYMMESFALVIGLRDDARRYLREHFVAKFGDPPEAFSTHALAPRVTLPTLVVHDRDDDVAPLEHAQGFAAALPDGTLHVTHGLNHSGPLRDPATIGTIVAFLRAKATAG